MLFYTRQEFIDHWNSQGYVADTASYLWLPESEIVPGPIAEYFVLIKPLSVYAEYEKKQEYWRWCDQHLEYPLRCYYSGEYEAWGFVTKQDATVWLLKYA